MIRRSSFVAIAAIALSVLLHIFGLRFTFFLNSTEPAPAERPSQTVALGNAFEDLADPAPKPVEPEPADSPEPADQVEIPISETLVASSDPQKVTSPDIGEAVSSQPATAAPEVTDPVGPSEGQREASDDVDETPPVQLESASPAVQPEEPVEPVDRSSAAPEQLAALPAPSSPALPVPFEPDTTEPEADSPIDDNLEQDSDTDDGDSDLAVVTSVRPRLPDRRPATTQSDTVGRPESFDNLKFPDQEIDSPLTTYSRKGIDAFTRSGNSNRSGGRGPGNSNVTNYAGRVLVHLNKAPPVYVSVRGFAQVFFEINPDGTLAWVDIVDSSGSPEVDRAAKEQVRRAAPFPLPPGGVGRKLSFYFQNG